MATRIVPNLPENGPSAFEHRSEHGRYLLSDRDYVDERHSVVSARSNALPTDTARAKQTSSFTSIAQTISVYKASCNADNEKDDSCVAGDRDFVTDHACEPAGDKGTVDGYLALFPHRNESVVRYSDFAEWREVSRFHYLSDEEILATLRLDSKLKRAVRFDATTRLQVLYIPFESPYLNIPSASLLKQLFKNLGITIKHYQYNNDWYFYLFFSDFIDSSVLQTPVTNVLEKAGFKVSESSLVVCSATTAVPLPVQPGFAWINDRGQVSVRRDEISLQGALALFVSDAKRCALSVEKFLPLLLGRIEAKSGDAGKETARANSIAAAANVTSDAISSAANSETQDVGLTTISLLESVGLNVGEQDRISCFTVFDAPESDTRASASDFARKIANCKHGTANKPVDMNKTSRAMEAMTIRKRMSTKLEPGFDASDADYLQKLNQALRHP